MSWATALLGGAEAAGAGAGAAAAAEAGAAAGAAEAGSLASLASEAPLTYSNYYGGLDKSVGIPNYEPGPYDASGNLMEGATGNVPYGTAAKEAGALPDQFSGAKKAKPDMGRGGAGTGGGIRAFNPRQINPGPQIPLPALARFRDPRIMRRY